MDNDMNKWFAVAAIFYVIAIAVFVLATAVESRYPELYVIVEAPGWFSLAVALILTIKGSLE